MKYIFRAWLVLCAILVPYLLAQANTEIYYIGFNRFVTDNGTDSGVVFDDYIRELRPIMERYGMTVESYDVLHGGSDDLAADVVTFGTAPDQDSFQAFFHDPEFQQIFPRLLGALSDHQVIFTSDPFSISDREDGHTLLKLVWMGGDVTAGLARLEAINAEISPLYGRYGVELAAQTAGVLSNRGLASEVIATIPPHRLELWSIRNAHEFFDDPAVQDNHQAAEKVVSRSESFWLKGREIR